MKTDECKLTPSPCSSAPDSNVVPRSEASAGSGEQCPQCGDNGYYTTNYLGKLEYHDCNCDKGTGRSNVEDGRGASRCPDPTGSIRSLDGGES